MELHTGGTTMPNKFIFSFRGASRLWLSILFIHFLLFISGYTTSTWRWKSVCSKAVFVYKAIENRRHSFQRDWLEEYQNNIEFFVLHPNSLSFNVVLHSGYWWFLCRFVSANFTLSCYKLASPYYISSITFIDSLVLSSKFYRICTFAITINSLFSFNAASSA